MHGYIKCLRRPYPNYMNPKHDAKDVVWCTLCKDAVGPMYFEVCLTHLCEDEFIGKHISD